MGLPIPGGPVPGGIPGGPVPGGIPGGPVPGGIPGGIPGLHPGGPMPGAVYQSSQSDISHDQSMHHGPVMTSSGQQPPQPSQRTEHVQFV